MQFVTFQLSQIVCFALRLQVLYINFMTYSLYQRFVPGDIIYERDYMYTMILIPLPYLTQNYYIRPIFYGPAHHAYISKSTQRKPNLASCKPQGLYFMAQPSFGNKRYIPNSLRNKIKFIGLDTYLKYKLISDLFR